MKEKGSKNFLSSAFTDLMASLAIIFILLTVLFIRYSSQGSQKGKEALRSQLAEVLDRNQLPLEQDVNDPLSLSVRLSDSLLKFSTNSSTISNDGEKFIDRFFPALTKELCSDKLRNRLDAIIIEGHTDDTGEQTNNGSSNNIRLSQNRSFSVLTRALSGLKNNQNLYDCLSKLALASGRGASVPILVNNEYKPDLSRRVEIKIRVKSSEQDYFLKERQRY